MRYTSVCVYRQTDRHSLGSHGNYVNGHALPVRIVGFPTGFHRNYLNGRSLPARVPGFPRELPEWVFFACPGPRGLYSNYVHEWHCLHGSRGFHGSHANECA